VNDGHGRYWVTAGLVAVAAGWGLTFSLIQDVIDTLSPMSFIAYRFLLAALVLVVPYAPGLVRLPARAWGAGLLLGLLLCLGYVSQTVGLLHTSASNAGFITGLYVVFTPLLGWIFLRQHLTRWACGCLGLATVGLLLLSGIGGSPHALGDGLMLLCSLSFAVHILVTDKVMAHFPVGPLVVIQLSVCGAGALLLAVASNELTSPSGEQEWTALLFTAVFASALAYFIQSYAQQRIPPARTSLILATEPVFGGVFGYLLAGDRLSSTAWLGAAVMTIAVLSMESRPFVLRTLGRGRDSLPR
jgi:drug/metabolite transporter (DMT)-like permease